MLSRFWRWSSWSWMAVIVLCVSLGGVGVAWSMGDPGLIEMPRLPTSDPDSDSDQAPVVFDHWSHQQYFVCFACHPSIFPMEPKAFNHDDMDAGKYCGACHDDSTAFSPDDEDIECEVCHVE